ncbi:hypothetical protein ARSEF1564_008463 [Beauveria bassiana]
MQTVHALELRRLRACPKVSHVERQAGVKMRQYSFPPIRSRSRTVKQALHALIDKKTITQPSSTSPASTITTVPNTPRADSSGFEVDNDLNGAVQHSPHDSLTTSVPQGNGLAIAEQDHGQAEDGNESVLSDCDYEAGDRAELPRQSQSHESGDCDGSHDADSGSSSNSDGGSDGDADADYNDDGSFSDTDGEDSGRSKKRGTARSPSVTSSDNVHADDPPDDPPDDNAEENPPRPHKRQKVAHDEEDMTDACPSPKFYASLWRTPVTIA